MFFFKFQWSTKTLSDTNYLKFCNTEIQRVLIVCLNILVFGIYQDVSADKPRMKPLVSELLIQEGSELRIECFIEKTPLQFSFPEYTFHSPRSNHSISRAENGTITFLRQKAISLDTGWYACASEGVQIDNDFRTLNHTHEDIAWIYIYVNSSEPFADRYYTFAKQITIAAGSTPIVPCRPTSPDLTVQLWRNFEIVKANEEIWFEPKIGFIVKPPLTADFPIIYQCIANGIMDEYVLDYLNKSGRKPKMNIIVDKPLWQSKNELSLQSGDELRIECWGETKIDITFPQSREYSDQTSHFKLFSASSEYELLSDDKGKITFIRRNVVPEDTGFYACLEKELGGFGFDGGYFARLHTGYERKDVTSTYIYVKSGIPAFLPSVFPYQYIYGNTSLRLPCLPTSPFDIVELRKEGSNSSKLDDNVRFDPRFGIFLRWDTVNLAGCYSCLIYDKTIGYTAELANICLDNFEYPDAYVQPEIFPKKTHILLGEKLTLKCSVLAPYLAYLEWNMPSTVSKERAQYELTLDSTLGGFIEYHYEKTLIITNVTKSDSGKYTCVSKTTGNRKETSHYVNIVDPNGSEYIKSGESTKMHAVVGQEGQSVMFLVDTEPFLSNRFLKWNMLSGKMNDAPSKLDGRYNFSKISEQRAVLIIRNLNLGDIGRYEIQLNYQNALTIFNITLDVQSPPTASLQNKVDPYYVAPDEAFTTLCNTTGSPRPNITWTFAKYPDFPSDKNSSFANNLNYVVSPGLFEYAGYSYLNMSTEISGILTCTACNVFNCSYITKRILVSDGIGRFGIIGPMEPLIFVGDDVALTCAASVYAFRNLSWDVIDACPEDVNHNVIAVKKNQTPFTLQSVIYMKNLTMCRERQYTCFGEGIDGSIEKASYDLQLNIPRKPEFTRTNLNGTNVILHPESENRTQFLTCCANGEPPPVITWFKDDEPLEESPEHQFSPESCRLVVVLDLRSGKGGKYTCQAENRFGKIRDHIYFSIKGVTTGSKIWLSGISVLVLILGIVSAAWLAVRNQRRKVARQRYKEAILERFEEGALNRLNPDLNIVDQAEKLPYDEIWEYPRELLTLGRVLGSGAFGIVRKAQAKSICSREPITTVAVKMVRATFRLHHITALFRELKILVHLGQHVNIVNLLGACTQNVAYGELFVIVEFCRYGNLKDYLSRHRNNFIDKLETEEIVDSDLNADRVGVDCNSANDDGESGSDTRSSCCSSDVVDNKTVADGTVSIDTPMDSGLRSKYEGDYPDDILEPISTNDLLCWAWQVTRGMRYLGDRKVVHGDLAARNILLADNNVIKICDFGLAKALYKENIYKKQAQDPLPLKWAAVECIKDRTFSVQSDIWSYGVVLWELFSLGVTPYPGIHPEFLYEKLINGYRMDRPKYAPKPMYDIMASCWEADPEKRPSFAKIEYDIGEFLEDGVKTYYVDMNAPYVEINAKMFEGGKKDYFTMTELENVTVSFSSRDEEVQLNNVTSNESSIPVCPDTISDIENSGRGSSLE